MKQELETYAYPTEDCAPSPDQAGLTRLYQEIDRLAQAQAQEEAAEAALDEAKARRVRMEQEVLPGIMRELRLNAATSESGIKAKMVTKLRSSTAQTNPHREEAFDWLIANGHGDIVKHQITVDLPKECSAYAERILGSLRRWIGTMNLPISTAQGREVHNGQLNAVLKEAIAASVATEDPGPPVPRELFKAFEQTFVEIERPKAKK